MRNPRRDAIEYGILLTLATTAVVANGILIYFKRQGSLEKLDLTAPVLQQGDVRRPWTKLPSSSPSNSTPMSSSSSSSESQR